MSQSFACVSKKEKNVYVLVVLFGGSSNKKGHVTTKPFERLEPDRQGARAAPVRT
jgi:hypothetical protein